ncbi:MAG: CoA transferase [Comamonadaceae bacterium]|nr:MAG: CoA transferase [Comamonadaceae bacterium]
MTGRLPLEGVRVLDLTTFLSGPSATQLLGDLGAEIVKVESFAGDSSRAIPGHYVGDDSAYYLANNRNKLSLSVDLKDPCGVDIVRRLIAESDVVFENFRPGVCSRLGLGPNELTSAHPSLIWVSISGFGQDGPLRDRPAYDMIVQALSGVMSLTGHEDAPAARLGIPAGDVVAGLYAVIGTLAALHARDTGEGGRIVNVSMLDGQLAMLSYQAVYAAISGSAPGRQGARHDSIPTYRSFTGGDGREFVVTANTPRMWENMCTAMGLPDLLDDPRFFDGARRLENKDALWEILEARFAETPADVWVQKLVEANVPVAPIRDVVEALSDARTAGNDSLVEIANDSGSFENVATPIRFSDTPDAPRRYPPRLGEHTRTILLDRLRFDSDTFDKLVDRKVVQVAG